MKPIARSISNSRKEKGWTQEELAQHSQVSLRTIQRIEASEVVPRRSTLRLLCAALNLELDQLVVSDSFRTLTERRLHRTFMVVKWIGVNLVVMYLLNYLNFGLGANLNSRIGAWFLSFFIPFFLIAVTPKESPSSRFLKCGFALIADMIISILLRSIDAGQWDFEEGTVFILFSTSICAAIYMPVLYFGGILLSQRDVYDRLR